MCFMASMKYDVLIWLEHIFPNTYGRMGEHISPDKVGTDCLELKLLASS